MSKATHDLVVIGAGPGGYVAAIRAAQLGLSVACIDANPQFGGTCLRIGCIPSKALLESSELFAASNEQMAEHGIEIKKVKLDLKKMLARKDKIVEQLTGGIQQLFKKNKVKGYAGRGKIAGPGAVVVEPLDGSEPIEIAAETILIATGSKPAGMKGVEYDDDRIGDSTTALSYPEVPKKLIVIGGGYIGLELGSVWNRLGSEVTVLEGMDRILPGIDGEIAKQAARIFEKQGLKFQVSSWVESATVEGDHCVVRCKDRDPIKADRVLLAAGRVPFTEGLGLESVGVVTNKRGFIEVDKHFATGAKGVYAIGDVIGGAMLAHKASEEAMACIEQIVTGAGHINYETIPAVVYTHPEIATVGLTEEQLKEQGIEYKKGVCPFGAIGRALALGDTNGRVKILADAKTDRVLGVHCLGLRAGDLIAEAAVAMQFGASAEDIARCCHAHPTLSEAVHEAALAVAGRAIHT